MPSPRPKIHDELTGLRTRSGKPMSKQQLWIRRRQRDGKCRVCGKAAVGVRCPRHAKLHSQNQVRYARGRRKVQSVRRQYRQRRNRARELQRDRRDVMRFNRRLSGEATLRVALLALVCRLWRKRYGHLKKIVHYFREAALSKAPMRPKPKPFWR